MKIIHICCSRLLLTNQQHLFYLKQSRRSGQSPGRAPSSRTEAVRRTLYKSESEINSVRGQFDAPAHVPVRDSSSKGSTTLLKINIYGVRSFAHHGNIPEGALQPSELRAFEAPLAEAVSDLLSQGHLLQYLASPYLDRGRMVTCTMAWPLRGNRIASAKMRQKQQVKTALLPAENVSRGGAETPRDQRIEIATRW
jgi:hypothetical protein